MAEIKRGLGRGLDALLGDFAQTPPEGVQQADVYLIDPSAQQPRKAFDQERLGELSASILRHGMVQPIIVRQNGERYTIVAGERRYRAARMAGLASVPVIVKSLDEAQVMEVALIENLQRENLNPIEEAAAIRFLMQQHDLTQEEVALRLAKSRPAVANSLRLLSLPEPVQKLLREGQVQAGHARALVAIKDEQRQVKLAEKIAAEGLSVRDVEALAKAQEADQPGAKAPQKAQPRPNSDILAAENTLRERLGTKVKIQGSDQRGKIVIEYFSKQELQAIYDTITGE